jgi:transposase
MQQLHTQERYLVQHAKLDDLQTFARLQTVPGIGPILGLVLPYEVHDIPRFGTVQSFVSYCRHWRQVTDRPICFHGMLEN